MKIELEVPSSNLQNSADTQFTHRTCIVPNIHLTPYIMRKKYTLRSLALTIVYRSLLAFAPLCIFLIASAEAPSFISLTLVTSYISMLALARYERYRILKAEFLDRYHRQVSNYSQSFLETLIPER